MLKNVSIQYKINVFEKEIHFGIDMSDRCAVKMID